MKPQTIFSHLNGYLFAKANSVVALLLLTLFIALPLSAQINLANRFEIEGGIDLTFAADPKRSIKDYRASTQPGIGYRFGLNVHLIQQYRFNGLRSSLSAGILYGSTNYSLKKFDFSEEGTILASDGSRSVGTVREIDGTARMSAQSLGLQLMLRSEFSEKFALVLGLLFLDRRSGEVRFQRTYTDTHVYDPTRRIWTPEVGTTSFKTQSFVAAANDFRLQAGLEYYGWINGIYARLMLERGSSNSRYQFTTGHLNLMLGYRF